MELYFFYDESGDKGYLRSKPEPHDFCLIAGFVLPENDLTEFSNKLKILFDKIKIDDIKKLHATEIFKDNQNQEIKTEFIEIILNEQNLKIICSSLYSLGVYNERLHIEDLKKQAEALTKNSILPPIS